MVLNKSESKKAKRRVLYEITKHVSIRQTHLLMYRVLVIVAVGSIALAINLYLTKPTFAPYGLPKGVIATIFLFLGIVQLGLLSLYHYLKLVRLVLAASGGFMMFWGLSNTQQAFAGKSSFQLPILFVMLALIQWSFLLEPASNPLTEKNGGKK